MVVDLKKAYCDQLDAIEGFDLSCELFDPDDANRLERRLQMTLFLLGFSWFSKDSAFQLDLSSLHPNKPPPQPSISLPGVGADAMKRPLYEVLSEMLRCPDVVAELSHSQNELNRGHFNLPAKWEEHHREEFARVALEMLVAFCIATPGQQYRDLPLNVLIVDNALDKILEFNAILPPELGLLFWRRLQIYVPADDAPHLNLSAWLRQLDACREGKNARLLLARVQLVTHEGVTNTRFEVVEKRVELERDQLDLILQDFHLASAVPGTGLARLYFELMPQAMVFLTTGLDTRSLASRGETHLVDRTIPKRWLAALPWYYHQAFLDVLGAMFWQSWLAATSPGTGESRSLADRQAIRSLLGSVRRWLREPEILWHGQALAEMVDHGHQHISALWRISNEILGARNPSTGEPCFPLDALSTEERVILTLGIWLHDVGHRGDRFSVDPATIRDAHGSISEHLLLEAPEAFGLEWLRDFPTEENVDEDRWENRNRFPPDGERLRPLRLAGLLCRHHQSSAPLHREAIAGLSLGLKSLSAYSRVALGPDHELPDDALEKWTSLECDLEWIGSDVRTLEHFERYSPDCVDLRKTACLLRLLDAIHLDRCRAGSPTRRSTHRFYRRQRQDWVDRRLDRLAELLHRSRVGSAAYLTAKDEIAQLAFYRDLLGAQAVHLWRQAMVDRIEVDVDPNDGTINVRYHLLASAELEGSPGNGTPEDMLKEQTGKWLNKKRPERTHLTDALMALSNNCHRKWWVVNFFDEVLRPELEGQAYGLDRDQQTTLHRKLFMRNLGGDGATPDLRFVARWQGCDEDVVIATTSSPWEQS